MRLMNSWPISQIIPVVGVVIFFFSKVFVFLLPGNFATDIDREKIILIIFYNFFNFNQAS